MGFQKRKEPYKGHLTLMSHFIEERTENQKEDGSGNDHRANQSYLLSWGPGPYSGPLVDLGPAKVGCDSQPCPGLLPKH